MKSTRWVKLVTRPQTALTVDLLLRGLKLNFKKLAGTDLDVKGELDGYFGSIFEGIDSREAVNKIFEKRQEQQPNFFRQHVLDGEEVVERVIKQTNILGENTSKVNDTKLLERFEEFERIYLQFVPYLHTVFAPEAILTKKLKSQIKTELGRSAKIKIGEIFINLTTLQEETDFYREQKELLEIAVKFKRGKSVDREVDLHVRRFGYMGLTNSFLSVPYAKNHFLPLIRDAKDPEQKLNDLINHREMELKKYKTLIKTLSQDAINTAELLQSYMLFRNTRIEALKKSQRHIKPLLQEISSRFNESFENIIWYTADEIKKVVKGAKKVDVSRRKLNFVMMLVDGKISYSAEETATSMQRITRIIKGNPAQLGKAIGKVKLVFSFKDLAAIKSGDILVTTMTTPDFVIAMKKVGAIVTDEGGILSHAAIVSREFGIPCVIGTKIATQVLEDGELVEVNAYKGEIKRLST